MKATETYTSLKTSKLMHDALPMETGMCRLVASDGDRLMKSPTLPLYRYFTQYSAHTLASAMAWLKAYGEQELPKGGVKGVCRVTGELVDRNPVFLADCVCHHEAVVRVDMWQHDMLEAYLTHNTMDCPEVDAFFEELIK